MEGWMDSVPRLCASEDSPWLLDMADHVERAGTYALVVYLAVFKAPFKFAPMRSSSP